MEIKNILHADVLDIIFEGRNKNYGAYELRKTYNKRMLSAMAITAATCLSLYAVYASGAFQQKSETVVFDIPTTTLVEIKDEPKPVEVTPPPKQVEATPVRQVMSTTPIIVQNATPEEMPPTQEDLSTARIGTENIAGDIADDIVAPPMDGTSNGIVSLPQRKAENPDSVFMKVEIESQYPGGPTAWSRFLYRKLSSGYPEDAAEKGIQGRVEIQFIVDKEGNVSDVTAVSGPEELKDVAVKVIKQSGKWIPAIQNGQKVNSYKKQPITFALN